MGRTIGVIQAHLKSRRLPGQILAPLGGRPLLALLWTRIRAARVDEWWLATGSDPADDVTEAWGFELGLRVFRGDRRDALGGLRAIGTEAHAEWLVRIRTDHPFVDAKLIDATIDARDADEGAKRADLIRLRGAEPTADASDGSRSTPDSAPRLPLGYEVELLRRGALERADAAMPPEDPSRRGPATAWLEQPTDADPICDRSAPATWPDRSAWRWIVDSYEDLAMARSAFRLFGSEAASIDYPAMVARLDAHPEIADMNRHIAPHTDDRTPLGRRPLDRTERPARTEGPARTERKERR